MKYRPRSLRHIMERNYLLLCDKSREAYHKAGPTSFDAFQEYRARLRRAYQRRMAALEAIADR